LATLVVLLFSAGHLVAEDRERDWVERMKKVHAGFTGDAGTFAQFGDSITDSRAFWFSLRYQRDNAPPEMVKAFELVKERMIEDCWDGKGPNNGNQGRMTIRWAHENVSQWLKTLNPEVAIVMFGTNDLNSVPANEYQQKMREVVQRCLDNGTVVILSTIPPRHRFEEKSAQYAEIVRSIARELQVPLIDYHAEILQRRPDDWNGALGKFKEYQGYDVPTLIARDGVHPSAPKEYRGDYSMESLSRNGFALRNYLTLLKYGEVIEHVLSRK
jgi:lysophospholipase L1-like esterase